MAKSAGSANKVAFGKRKTGKINGRKSYGPKAQAPKRYRGQGK